MYTAHVLVCAERPNKQNPNHPHSPTPPFPSERPSYHRLLHSLLFPLRLPSLPFHAERRRLLLSLPYRRRSGTAAVCIAQEPPLSSPVPPAHRGASPAISARRDQPPRPTPLSIRLAGPRLTPPSHAWGSTRDWGSTGDGERFFPVKLNGTGRGRDFGEQGGDEGCLPGPVATLTR